MQPMECQLDLRPAGPALLPRFYEPQFNTLRKARAPGTGQLPSRLHLYMSLVRLGARELQVFGTRQVGDPNLVVGLVASSRQQGVAA